MFSHSCLLNSQIQEKIFAINWYFHRYIESCRLAIQILLLFIIFTTWNHNSVIPASHISEYKCWCHDPGCRWCFGECFLTLFKAQVLPPGEVLGLHLPLSTCGSLSAISDEVLRTTSEYLSDCHLNSSFKSASMFCLLQVFLCLISPSHYPLTSTLIWISSVTTLCSVAPFLPTSCGESGNPPACFPAHCNHPSVQKRRSPSLKNPDSPACKGSNLLYSPCNSTYLHWK